MKKSQSGVTVTVFCVPSLCLASVEGIVEEIFEVPVYCLVSKAYRLVMIDVARPLAPLSADLLRPATKNHGNPFRFAFRQAVRLAVGKALGCEVGLLHDARVEWDEGQPTRDV